MNEHCVVATVADVARQDVDLVLREWTLSILDRQPGGLIGHVIDAGEIHAQFAVDGVRAVAEREEQELRDIGSDHVRGCKSPEQGLRRDEASESRTRETR